MNDEKTKFKKQEILGSLPSLGNLFKNTTLGLALPEASLFACCS
jgi:hypothetical protein